jgi:glycosyltransferase involved in cell wall biosynthesis
MEISVVIPTRNRLAILRQTLTRLGRQSGHVQFEVLVVDDGSDDGTPEAVRELAAEASREIKLIEQPGVGPAAARNRALAVARAPVCLFLNDDSWPRGDLLERHRDFHARTPECEAALLGRIVPASDPEPTPFIRWLADLQFDYTGIDDAEQVRGARFFTANVSAKTEFLRAAGGFDERFASAAYEDIDLGLRLEKRGLRLAFDAGAVVEHCHPLDLEMALDRLRGVGRALAPFAERHPDWAVPRPPGARHRVKAAALTGLLFLRMRSPGLQHETWRFLCHEAAREGYWSAVRGQSCPTRLRIGERLARRAALDEDVRLPSA